MQQYQRDTHASSGDLNASLGKGSEFEGKLAFEGKVRIDGTFTGEISTNDTLHIGEGAKVSQLAKWKTAIELIAVGLPILSDGLRASSLVNLNLGLSEAFATAAAITYVWLALLVLAAALSAFTAIRYLTAKPAQA